jgi:hypothetical protein
MRVCLGMRTKTRTKKIIGTKMGKTRRYNPDESWGRRPKKKSQKKVTKPSYGYHRTEYDEEYSYGQDQFQRFDGKRRKR